MRFRQILYLLCWPLLSFAQANLVQNPSFEVSKKEDGIFEIEQDDNLLFSWWNPLENEVYLFAEPEAYIAKAAEGKKAIGLILGDLWNRPYNSYLSGRLKSPLKQGEHYCLCFEVLLHRSSQFAASEIGLILHRDKNLLREIEDPQSLQATIYANDGKPISNSKWQKYCAYYEASGGERFISIGKFGREKAYSLKALNIEYFPDRDGYHDQAFYLFDNISLNPVKDSMKCSCAPPVSAPRPQNHRPYLFALDASESMLKKDYFDSLRYELSDFLNDLPDGSPLSFTKFAAQAELLEQGQKNGASAQKIDEALQRVSVKGSTNAFEGLKMAYSSRATESIDSALVILISDGRFPVEDEMVELVRSQYEQYHRQLIFIQIGNRALNVNRLKPYMGAYMHISPPEIHRSFYAIGKNQFQAINAEACPCVDSLPKERNYHFVFDYSGSTLQENEEFRRGLLDLYSKVPPQSLISISLFNHEADLVIAGKRLDIPSFQVDSILRSIEVLGGTQPKYGVQKALTHISTINDQRSNVIILLSDLATVELLRNRSMMANLSQAETELNLSTCVLQYYFAIDPVVEMRTATALFDPLSESFYTVSREKFENFLFDPNLLKCDYRSQPYHKGPRQSVIRAFMQEVQREY